MTTAAHDAAPILFAFDGSEHAKASIREAASQLVSGRGASVLTVWRPSATLAFGGAAAVEPELDSSLEREAEEIAEEGARLARSVGFAAMPVARGGWPVWRTIVEAATELGASIIVLGSHGRTGVGHLVLGSVAETVARHTDRPVLIAHLPSRAA
jgi:nucleotide-binding universal stress UspA family protein